MRIHITAPSRPKPKTGDVRITNKHGLQVRVPLYVTDMRGNIIGRNCTGGRPHFEWVKLTAQNITKYHLEYLKLDTTANDRILNRHVEASPTSPVAPQKVKFDATGKRYGILTAVSVVTDPPVRNQGIFWNCVCDCGNKTVARIKDLNFGNTGSCGCMKPQTSGNKPRITMSRPWRRLDEQ